MAAITLAECSVTHKSVGGLKLVKLVTPATADDGDTIDVSSLFNNGCFAWVSGATDNSAISAPTYEDKSITIPGSTDNEARTIIMIGD